MGNILNFLSDPIFESMYVTNFTVALLGVLITLCFLGFFLKKRPVKIWYLIVAFLISYPYQIKGDIYSLWGGENTNGSVYSLVPIYQNASKDAIGIVGPSFFQKAGGDAAIIAGVSVYQKAKEKVVLGIGGSIYQESEKNYALIAVGFSYYQKSSGISSPGKIPPSKINKRGATSVLFGISGYQEASEETFMFVGISGYQKANWKTNMGFGISSYQEAGDRTLVIAGISFYQKASKRAEVKCGISFYQEAQDSATVGFGIPLLQKARVTGISQKK